MNAYFRFGLIATTILMTLVVILAFGTVKGVNQPDTTRWRVLWNAPPNEIGDALAGVAGTLAFLWIIVTVMIQGNELRLQRLELQLTRRELRSQREASEAMALAQNAQTSLFQDERRRALEKEYASVFNNKLRRVLEAAQEFQKRARGMGLRPEEAWIVTKRGNFLINYSMDEYRKNDVAVRDFLEKLCGQQSTEELNSSIASHGEAIKIFMELVLRLLGEIMDLRAKVGMITKGRIDDIGIAYSEEKLREILGIAL